MPSLTIDSAQVGGDGRVRIRFGQREIEYASRRDFREALDEAAGEDFLFRLILAIIRHRMPDANTLPAVAGRTITVDFSLANVVRVT